MGNAERDELDGVLDRALEGYVGAEPRAGIEQRVLARIHAESGARRGGWARWMWVGAAAVAAAAVLAMIVAGWWMKPAPLPAMAFRRAEAMPVRWAARVEWPVPARKAPGLPKQPVFPMPKPVTDEERAWLALAQTGQAQQALLDLQRQGAEAIALEKIEIKPMRSDDAE